MADLEIVTSQNLSETTSASSGSGGEVAQPQDAGLVSYDTHKRLLGEKKKLQERLEQFENQVKVKQEEDLKSQNQYKALYENLQKEKETLHSKVSEQEQRWNNAIKLDSFMNSLGGRKIESKYAGFIDLEQILLDPESGQVDSLSVQREVERICKEFPEIIKGAVAPKGMPNEPPKNPYVSSTSLNALSSKDRLKAAAASLAKFQK